MKSILLIVLFCVGAFVLGKKTKSSEQKNIQPRQIVELTIPAMPDLNVLLDQDVTGSISQYGVELASSQQLTPYYYETRRKINLVFNLINDTSIGKPVEVTLPAKQFSCPQIGDYVDENSNYTDKRGQKLEFARVKRQYVEDSISFFRKRDSVFRWFCAKVDSIVSVYREHPDSVTDIGTRLETDRKILRGLQAPGSRNIVIMLTDGKDNRNKSINIQKLPATVILVNSGPAIVTPIDKLIDMKLATLENAIQISLNN